MGASSRLLQASLPRPLGIVFEEDAVRRRVVVSAFLDGYPAAQLAQVPAPAHLLCPVPLGPRQSNVHESLKIWHVGALFNFARRLGFSR